MEQSIRILVLTDHLSHSKENSLYALVSGMVTSKEITQVDVASRGLKQNTSFFHQMDHTALYAIEADNDFSFHQEELYSRGSRNVAGNEYDVVFLRLPRPVSDEFLMWIEHVYADATIINRPGGIIKTSSKAFLLNFPEICPPIKLCHSIDDILKMAQQFSIVLKPLRAYGGKGLLRIQGNSLDDGKDMYDTLRYLKSVEEYIEREGYLAMKFLKHVDQGDKRILVVGGEIMASSLRLPPQDSWLCNVAQGGRSVATDLTEVEREIIDKVNPWMEVNGILIYGVDTLQGDNGDRILSEINTLSIGGFPQAEKQTGKPVIKRTIEKIINYVNTGHLG